MNNCGDITYDDYGGIESDKFKINRITKEEFNDMFQLLGRLGVGQFGTVKKYLDKTSNKVLAIKSGRINTSEVEVGCKLNNLNVYTDGLVNILGWINIVDPQRPYNIQFKLVMPVLEEVSEIYQSTKNHNELEWEFELTIAKYILLRMAGIIIRDLHSGNIMAKRVDYQRVYTINGIQYIATNEYIPVIIDYGQIIIYGEYEDEIKRDISRAKKLVKLNRDITLNREIETLNDILDYHEQYISGYDPYYLCKMIKDDYYFKHGLYGLLQSSVFDSMKMDLRMDGTQYKIYQPFTCKYIDIINEKDNHKTVCHYLGLRPTNK